MYTCKLHCSRMQQKSNMHIMENSADENGKMIAKPLLDDDDQDSRKGGFRTMPFILGNESFEQMASFGLQPNMILYLTRKYHLNLVSGSNIIFFWSAATNFMPLLGALIADTLVGRFGMILFGCAFSILGTALLWLTALIPQARPPPCDESNSTCRSSTTLQLFLLCSCFGVMAIGAGGIRSSSLAFGADQLVKAGGCTNGRVLDSYFSWYYAMTTISVLIGFTCIVYVQEKMGWQVGFGIPVVLMCLSALSFGLASPCYVKFKAKSSLLVELFQVVVAAYRKRHVELSTESSNMLYHHQVGSSLLPSEKLRFLNKACIIVDSANELTAVGRATDPWTLCTTNQVEDLKMLIKVIPLWSTGMIMSVNISTNSFTVLQASSMNRKFGSSFEIPAGSFGMFTVISTIIWIALYNRAFLPILSRIMGRQVYLSTRKRMGVGILLFFVSMIVAATVEAKRRSLAIREGYSDDAEALVDMSAIWLLPQLCLIGFAVASSAVAQNEFYYSEFPRSMSSVASTMFGLGMSVANVLASLLMNIIDKFSKQGGKDSWISTNINKGHYDYYCWILAGLNMLNMIYFLICSKAYGLSKEDIKEPILHEQEY